MAIVHPMLVESGSPQRGSSADGEESGTVEPVQRGEGLKAAIEQEWSKALDHAAIDPRQARLWFGRGPHQESAGANYYLPVRLIEGEHGLDDEQLAEAHSDLCAELHRVVVYPDYAAAWEGEELAEDTVIPIFGAILRHELQHALQFATCGGEVFDVEDLVEHIIEVKAGGLPGSMAVYNTKPMEIDANDAAASYLRDVHPEQVEAILNGSSGQLARSNTGPEDPSTLLSRSICFLYVHREACRKASGQVPFVERIRVCSQDGAALWNQIEATERGGEGT